MPLENDVPCLLFVLCIVYSRLTMKMHSFVTETLRMREQRPHMSVEDCVEDAIDIIDDPSRLFWQYHYFLWAPTLIYRNVYPRSPYVRWSLVIEWLFKFAGGFFSLQSSNMNLLSFSISRRSLYHTFFYSLHLVCVLCVPNIWPSCAKRHSLFESCKSINPFASRLAYDVAHDRDLSHRLHLCSPLLAQHVCRDIEVW